LSVTYAATVVARIDGDWTADDVELTDVEDLDGVVELTRSVAGDEAEIGLLFVEENDEWFGVLRVDADDEPRVFISDARMVGSSDLAGLLGEGAMDIGVEEDGAPDDEPDESAAADPDESVVIDSEPAGDAALLSDLGSSSRRLLDLCAAEGQLPADVISALCESAGCLDVLEKLRGT
jgi:putative tRNA adenosine deaminase-associated protein